ncbi:MAG: MBL fold metallo-hydrolase [Anaerovoracaceae bacterium]
MQIWEKDEFRIHRLGNFRCNCYLILGGQKAVLVDAGVKSERKILVKGLETLGITRLDGLIITHNHGDHTGNAAYLQKRFGCPIFAQAEGIAGLQAGRWVAPKGTDIFGKIVYAVETKFPAKAFSQYESCVDVRDVFEDFQGIFQADDVQIVRTEGHTVDSISVVVKQDAAIIGDAFVLHPWRNRVTLSVADEGEKVVPSWEVLLETGCRYFLPAHGRVTSREMLANSLLFSKKIRYNTK